MTSRRVGPFRPAGCYARGTVRAAHADGAARTMTITITITMIMIMMIIIIIIIIIIISPRSNLKGAKSICHD